MNEDPKAQLPWWRVPHCQGRLGQGILLLIAVVLFVLAATVPWWYPRPRERARAASCLANMKSLALCTLSYAHDWDDHLPPRPAVPTPQNLDDGKMATDALARYLSADDWRRRIHYINGNVFFCPSTRSLYSYQFNDDLYGVSLRDCDGWPEGLTFALLEYETGFLTGLPVGPHSKGYNTTYCDGHAKWMSERSSQNMR